MRASRGQLGGVVTRGKPLSTLMDIARGKDEQLVDLSGFYVMSRVLTWTVSGENDRQRWGWDVYAKGACHIWSESGMILWRKKMNRWWSSMNGWLCWKKFYEECVQIPQQSSKCGEGRRKEACKLSFWSFPSATAFINWSCWLLSCHCSVTSPRMWGNTIPHTVVRKDWLGIYWCINPQTELTKSTV